MLREGPLRAEGGRAIVLDFSHLPLQKPSQPSSPCAMLTEADLMVCVQRLPCPLVSG